MTENVLLGMQGWDRPEWVGQVYPPDIQPSEMLGTYSRLFPTVEIDDTFYGIPPEPLVRSWLESVPAQFTFSLKAPQQITHELRFTGGAGLFSRFLDRVSRLGGHLGPVLLLAPPGFTPDGDNKATLRRFLEGLPADFKWALELRHKAWFTDEIFELLRKRNVAAVVGENRWIRQSFMLELANAATADFAYVRWNAPRVVDRSKEVAGDEEQVTMLWAGVIEKLSARVGTVFGYFNITAFEDVMRSAEEIRRVVGHQRIEDSVAERAFAQDDKKHG